MANSNTKVYKWTTTPHYVISTHFITFSISEHMSHGHVCSSLISKSIFHECHSYHWGKKEILLTKIKQHLVAGIHNNLYELTEINRHSMLVLRYIPQSQNETLFSIKISLSSSLSYWEKNFYYIKWIPKSLVLKYPWGITT